MRYIKPIAIGDAQLVSSNVPEDSTPVWSGATAYEVNAEVRVGHDVYEAAEANTGKNPADAANRAIWPVRGVTNRMKMFDMKRGQDVQTVNAESISVVLQPGSLYSSLALFGLRAKSLFIEIIVGESVAWSDTFSLRSMRGINTYFAWFNAPFQSKSQFVTFALPYFPGAKVRVTLSQPGGVARCGKLVIGWGRSLGFTKWKFDARYQDFSDMRYDTFGNLILKPRRKPRQRNFIVQVPSERLADVESQLIELDGSPTVFAGSENHEMSIVLGVVADFSSTYEFKRSNYNLKIMGL